MNIPANQQRLYKFHSEQHYYPYRKNFCNLWMLVLRDKTKENGAMIFKHKGHKRTYSFNEYSGFNKIETTQQLKNFFRQFEIPENELSGLDEVVVDQ